MPPPETRPTFAFFCPSATRLFRPSAPARVGGAEVRAGLFARELARQGALDVRMVVFSDRAQAYESHGVHLEEWPMEVRPGSIQLPASVALQEMVRHVQITRRPPWLRIGGAKGRLLRQIPLGLLGIAFWWRRMRRMRALFRALEADVYGFMMPTMETRVGLECNAALGRRSILFLASDANLGSYVYEGSMEIGPKGATFGYMVYEAIMKATHIVVQTEHQARRLHERFGRQATIIRNPIDLRSNPMPAPAPTPYVLWVGRGDQGNKRPRLCFELARRCPDLAFLMVMNPVDENAQRALKHEAPENVTIVDFVPYDEIEAYFQHATALVSTSAFEGFPNTFLQAGKHGVPVLSLEVDPDGILAATGGGRVAGGEMAQLARHLRALTGDPAAREACGRRLRDYVREHHELEAQVEKLAEVIREVAK